MHSPLLKESQWVSHPPPTYMLKFSGLADLSSCFEEQTGKQPIHTNYFAGALLQMSTYPSTATSTRQSKEQYIICVMGNNLLWHTTTHHSRSSKRQLLHFACAHECTDTETGKPSGEAWRHNAHSNLYWFTEFCYSACLSHFAAPFIVIPAKASNAENCVGYCSWKHHASSTKNILQREIRRDAATSQGETSASVKPLFRVLVNFKYSHKCWQGVNPM